MTRMEIKNALKIEDGGDFTNALRNLNDCDFIRQYSAFGKSDRGTLFQLTDLFTLFHLRYVKGYKGQDEHHWQNMLDSPSRRAWSGYSFEQLCLHHIRQIKSKLGISGIQSDVCSWKGDGTQIDLLIDRRDQTINVCEIKFSQSEFEITKQGEKVAIFGLGSFLELAEQTASALKQQGINATIINPRFSSLLDKEMLEEISQKHETIITLEDGCTSGGFGEKIARFFAQKGIKTYCFGADKEFTNRVSATELYRRYNLSPEEIIKTALK